MRLAEEVRGLFGEVAAEGLGFADVAENDLLATLDGEQRRVAHQMGDASEPTPHIRVGGARHADCHEP